MADNPEIIAHFLLDPEGKPRAIDRNGLKHYFIQLNIAHAPTDAYAVTYKLHESYYDPERESREPGGFSEEITSYGDYQVNAEVRTKKRVATASNDLLRALQRGHTEPSAEIMDALRDIAAH